MSEKEGVKVRRDKKLSFASLIDVDTVCEAWVDEWPGYTEVAYYTLTPIPCWATCPLIARGYSEKVLYLFYLFTFIVDINLGHDCF